MARIAGVNIPTNKRVEIALTYVYGIGRTKALEIRKKAGLTSERRINDLNDSISIIQELKFHHLYEFSKNVLP